MTDKNDEFGFNVDTDDANSLSSMVDSADGHNDGKAGSDVNNSASDSASDSAPEKSTESQRSGKGAADDGLLRNIQDWTLHQAHAEYGHEKGLPESKKSNKLLILGASGGAVALIVALSIYLLLPVVIGGGSQGERGNGAFASNEQEQALEVEDDYAFSQLDSSNVDIESDLYRVEPVDSGLSGGLSNDINEHDLAGSPESPLAFDDIYSDIDSGDVAGDSSIGDGDVVITDEDRMYDNLLAEASVIDAPHEAIKIDRSVVNNELQGKRLSRVESEVAQTRKELSDMSELIGAIRKQTADIASAIESNNATSKQFSADIKKLSERVESQIKAQKADISALQIDLKNVKSSSAPSNSVVAAVAPQAAQVNAVKAKNNSEQDRIAKEAMAKKLAMAKAVTLAAPKPRPVAVRAPTPKASTTRGCAVTKVSENWRVKGVTPSSAYVERVQDGQGLLLKAGVGLPGFGTVVSFNPTDRSVCTSSGIVRR